MPVSAQVQIGLRFVERPEQIVDFQSLFAFDAGPPFSAVLPRNQVVPQEAGRIFFAGCGTHGLILLRLPRESSICEGGLARISHRKVARTTMEALNSGTETEFPNSRAWRR